MKAKLILNPLSRRAIGSWRLSKILRVLEKRGFSVEAFRTVLPGDAHWLAANAKDESYDLVICAGGDGTINEVINGIANTDVILGLLPMGTGNVLACELRIPLNLLEACKVITSGRVREIDLCKLNDKYFSCMAGIGVDAQVVKELNPRMKGIFGKLAYPFSALRTLSHYDPPELKIEIGEGEQSITGYAAVVCNSMHYGGKYKLCPFAMIDDGWLDLCILQKRDIASIIRSGITVLSDHRLYGKGLKYYRVKSLCVSSSQEVPIQADGDIIGATPAKFSVIPKALRIMVPA
jgi:diacylglycerol kinase (ATP)